MKRIDLDTNETVVSQLDIVDGASPFCAGTEQRSLPEMHRGSVDPRRRRQSPNRRYGGSHGGERTIFRGRLRLELKLPLASNTAAEICGGF